MPYAKTRRNRKRNYRRKAKSYRKRSNMLSFQKAPMPNRFAAKLRYASFAELNPGAGGIPGVQIVSANGLFDPDISGVGHQPRGFDQFMVMYDHYTVVGAKITARFANQHNTTDHNRRIGITLKDSYGSPADTNEYAEARNTTTSMLVSTAVGYKQLTKAYSTRKFLGVSKPLASSLTRGSATGNPSEQAYFHLWNTAYSGTDIGACRVDYFIDYLVVFTEPKQPAQS